MHADWDDDDFIRRPAPKKRETSLVIQIAIGVFVGNLAYGVLGMVIDRISTEIQMNQIQMELNRWEKSGYKGMPFQR